MIALTGLVCGTVCGLAWLLEAEPPPPGPLLGWVWLGGGFASFAGGVLLVKHSRPLALLCAFAGFVVLLLAGVCLNEASRAWHIEHRGYWNGHWSIE